MAVLYPSEIDQFVNPAGTQRLDTSGLDHTTVHANHNDAIEAIEAVCGTTNGTNVLKNFSAGDFPARINASNVLQQVISGTINNSTLGTPSVTGGTATSQVIASPVIRAYDGWIDANETWTYASASTITVPSGAQSKYQKGDRIKFTQTTVKYGVITAVADTLLTIAVNTDYVVADAAISANYYSHEMNPVGYPHWFAYTTSWDANGGSAGDFAITTTASKFKIDGSTCTFYLNILITNKGSYAGDIVFSMPVTSVSNIVAFAGSLAASGANPIAASKGMPHIYAANSLYASFLATLDDTKLQWAAIANNDRLFVNGSYSI